jgi:hypothetical protein
MEYKLCLACRKLFRPFPQTPNQRYCSKPDCQRTRRRQWQKAKLLSDPDYRENQDHAQRAWIKSHPTYWREYRRVNPTYADRNRAQQVARNGRCRTGPIAKMDALFPSFPLPSGEYWLRPAASGIAKMDAYAVKIILLSMSKEFSPVGCKERTK